MRSLVLLLLICSSAVSAQMRRPVIREAFARSTKASIYYKTVGQGPALFILHGGPGMDHRYMYQHFLELADKYRLVFIDQRCTGSSRCVLNEKDVTIERFVQDIDAVRRHLGLQKIHILGHSWGGLLGVHYTVRYPANVRSLILMNSSGLTGEAQKKFFDNLESMRTDEEKKELETLEKSNAYIAGDVAALTRHNELYSRPYFFDPEKVKDMAYAPGPLTAKNGKSIRTWIWRFLLTYDLRHQAGLIRCPVLILHGDNDVIPLEVAEETNEVIKGSRITILKDTGHYSFVEKKEEVLDEIKKFLKRIAGK